MRDAAPPISTAPCRRRGGWSTSCPDRTPSWLSAKIAWCVRRVWSRARSTCSAATPPAAGSRTNPAPTTPARPCCRERHRGAETPGPHLRPGPATRRARDASVQPVPTARRLGDPDRGRTDRGDPVADDGRGRELAGGRGRVLPAGRGPGVRGVDGDRPDPGAPRLPARPLPVARPRRSPPPPAPTPSWTESTG